MMEKDNVIYLPVPELSPEQRQYWHSQAAYWDEMGENASLQLEYAQRQREAALRVLGMIATERGLEG